MTAKQLLQELVKAYPDVVAIAQDEDGNVFVYKFSIPDLMHNDWSNYSTQFEYFYHRGIIEWDSEDWKERIVTINDL